MIIGLNQKKSISGSISAKVLNMAAKVICAPLTDCFNAAIFDGVFPDEPKLANVVPVFKKSDATSKVNYRPISILPPLSKVFERFLFNRMSKYFVMGFSQNSCVVLEKVTALSMPCLSYLSNGSKVWTKLILLVVYFWICLKLLTRYHMICCLQNLLLMALINLA